MTMNERNLSAVIEACRHHDLKPIALAGTLLGLIRDGRLIPWDPDIDIGFLESDLLSPNMRGVVNELCDHGFVIDRVLDGMQCSMKRHGMKADLILLRKDPATGTYYNGVWYKTGIWPFRRRRMKKQWHDAFVGIQPSDRIGGLWVPMNPRLHLYKHYGPDWETPRKDWHWMKDPENIR